MRAALLHGLRRGLSYGIVAAASLALVRPSFQAGMHLAMLIHGQPEVFFR